MKTKTLLYYSLMAGSIFSTISFFHPVLAQAQSASEKEVDQVLVTGSRIRRNPLDAVSPVTTLDQQDIDRSGLNSIADVLQKLPASSSSLNTKNNNSGNIGFSADGAGIGAGAAQIALHNLGSKRTLVLVDGRRWVNGSSASGVSPSVDLNTIPMSLIKNIEILQDGASTIYGSDAIGGVVNIITRDRFEGFDARAYLGGYDKGDGYQQNYSVSFGKQADQTHFFISLDYARQSRVMARDRSISKYPLPNTDKCYAYCSSGTPQGRLVFTDPNTGKENNLTLNTGIVNNGKDKIPRYNASDPGNGDDFHEFGTSDRFNYQSYNPILNPNNRLGFFVGIDHEFSPNLVLKLKGLYNKRKSSSQAAPEPLFLGADAGNNAVTDTITIHKDNPYNPFGATIGGMPGDFFGRRPIEAGPRIFRQIVNTYFLSSVLEGNVLFASRKIYWDLGLSYSENEANQKKYNGFNGLKLKTALGDPQICKQTLGCVPFNLFGGQGANGEGSITKEMLDYVTFIQKDASDQKLIDFSFNMSTDLYQLPAGMLAFASGFEYRKEDGSFTPDSVVSSGDTAGVPATPTSGSYEVYELYGELWAPILANQTLFHQLDVSLAARYSKYSTFGSNTSAKIGVYWKPIEDFLFRAAWSQGYRAPSIGELYSTGARSDVDILDPCSDFNGLEDGSSAASETIKNNCIKEFKVPANGSYVQKNAQISVATGGNTDLKEEKSENIILSAVYSPKWVNNLNWAESLDFELDWYSIEIDHAVRARNPQLQIDQCVSTLDPILCAGIRRTSAGTITYFANRLLNIGKIKTSGIDYAITWRSPEYSHGQYRAKLSGTYLIEYDESYPITNGIQIDKLAGLEIGSPEAAYPKLKQNLTLDWIRNQYSASMTARYVDSVDETCTDSAKLLKACTGDKNKLDAVYYLDLSASYKPKRFNDSMKITFGINNLFDQKPSACYTCATSGFDETIYDIPGRFVFLRLTYQYH